jgi:hypothetical protein
VKPDANSDKRRSEQDKGGEFRHGTHLFLTERSKQVVLVFMLTCCTSILAETYFRGHLSGNIGVYVLLLYARR